MLVIEPGETQQSDFAPHQLLALKKVMPPRHLIVYVLVALFLSLPAQSQAAPRATRYPEHFSLSTFDATISANWLGGNGSWTNGSLWSTAPAYPNNGNASTYDATISGGTVTLDRNIAIQKLYLNGGFVNGSFNLTLNEGIDWAGGGLSSSGVINLGAGSTSTFSGVWPTFAVIFSGPTINNSGSVLQNTDIADDAKVLGIINNLPGATWNVQGHRLPDAITFNNAGNFVAVDAEIGGPFNNTGNVTVGSNVVPDPNAVPWESGLNLYGGGTVSGIFNVRQEAELSFWASNGPAVYTLAAGTKITGSGYRVYSHAYIDVVGDTTVDPLWWSEGGSLTIEPGVTLTLNGSLEQLFARTVLRGGTINTQTLWYSTNGNLEGFGTVNGDVSMGEANLIPAATGTLTLNGDVYFAINNYLIMSIGGTKQGNEYSYLSVSGTIYLGSGEYGDCVLFLYIINNFQSQLTATDVFTIAHADRGIFGTLAANTPNDFFLYVPNGQRAITTDGKASFQVNYGDGSPYGAGNLVLSKAIVFPTPPPLPGLKFEADAGIILPPFVASSGNVSQNVETDDPSLGGRASYLFTVAKPGDYIVSAKVNAPDGGHNSFFIDIDSEPTDPEMIWDIVSYTHGLEQRTASWRGTGTFDAPEIVPKKFSLQTGTHELVIRGREAGTVLGTITIIPDYIIIITQFEKNFDGSITLSWTGKTGKTYYVQRASNASFAEINYQSSAISGTEPQCHFTDPATNLVGVQRAFYRISVVSAP